MSNIKCIYFADADINYTYGLSDWQNYYKFLCGTYTKNIKKTSDELKKYYLFNYIILLRDLLKIGINELESRKMVTDSIDEFLQFYRDSHTLNPKLIKTQLTSLK